jgi:hypothetical protein
VLDDRELRERFAELRRADQARAGEYLAVLYQPARWTRHVRPAKWAAVAGLALVIAVAVLLVERSKRRYAGSHDVSITEWKSPTDFLLRTPGQEVLQTIPQIGEWPASARIRPEAERRH